MEAVRDKYDDAIDLLVANPVSVDDDGIQFNKIEGAWGSPYDPGAGCLFQYADVNEKSPIDLAHGKCGCLTMIRGSVPGREYVAWTPELTAEIKADERLAK